MTGEVRVEQPRGCGYRKPGPSGVGIYLVGPANTRPCTRVPLALHSCPVCSGGVKPTRGFTWIEPQRLLGLPERSCALDGVLETCHTCLLGMGMPAGRHGLLWIGEKYYGRPEAFMAEARLMGVSRRLSALPRELVMGETAIYLAHRRAVIDRLGGRTAGVFSAFVPTGVELVVADAENPPARAQRMAADLGDRGRIVQVIPAEQSALPLTDAAKA